MRLLCRSVQGVNCVLYNTEIDEVCLAWMRGGGSLECILLSSVQKYTRLMYIKSGLDRGSDFLSSHSHEQHHLQL